LHVLEAIVSLKISTLKQEAYVFGMPASQANNAPNNVDGVNDLLDGAFNNVESLNELLGGAFNNVDGVNELPGELSTMLKV
jgi:hypothetical protein